MKALLNSSVAIVLMFAGTSLAAAQSSTSPAVNDPASNINTPADASSRALQPGFYDQNEIERRLEARGFDEVDVKLDDQNYTGSANWYGEEVDVIVTASTGRLVQPSEFSADQIKAKLEDEGYENVSEVEQDGEEFTARGDRFGEEMELRVNATTGGVVDPRELKSEQIETKLEEDGYSNIVIFEREGDYGNFYASADKDDETFLLEVNPLSGRIMDERSES